MQGATGTTGPQGASSMVFVEAATGITGAPTSCPLALASGQTLRVIGGTGMSVAVITGMSGPDLVLNSTASGMYRYNAVGATTFSGVVRSKVPNNISVVTTIVSDIMANGGMVRNIHLLFHRVTIFIILYYLISHHRLVV